MSSALARALRGVPKGAARAYGMATAVRRDEPDFLLIGTKRGGTTSFYFDLLEHPAVLPLFPPPIPLLKPDATKGVHYFDSHATRGPRWYRSYMPTRGQRRRAERATGASVVAGEASPYYLFHPAAAARAHALLPRARIVVLLREPGMRTYSHWKERRRSHAEPLDFEAALEAEPGRLAGERERLLRDPSYLSYAWEQQSYLTQSRYVHGLRIWTDLYGRDRVLVLASEDYYADPLAVLRTTDEFLGIPPRSRATAAVRNAAAGEALDPALRERLRAELATDTAALGELTGRAFPWG